MEPWKKALENGLKDFMWSVFWKGHQRADLEQLEESCQKLIRLASQKSGTYVAKDESTKVSYNNIDMVYQEIAMGAVALILDSRFDALKEAWAESDDEVEAWQRAEEKWCKEAREDE